MAKALSGSTKVTVGGKAKVDISDLIAYEQQLRAAASSLVEELRDDWKKDWGQVALDEILKRAPRSSGVRSKMSQKYGPITGQVRQVYPGRITFGTAFYWRFHEYGTSKMGPRPFVRPALKKVRLPARKDAASKALALLSLRRVA